MALFDSNPDQLEAVGDKVLFMPGDCLRLLEDEYWAELDSEVLLGWKTHEEASSAFLAWRAGYRVIEVVSNENVI